jgi:non-ribosomal peptide synthetase component F
MKHVLQEDQLKIQRKWFYPRGEFVEFRKEEIEQSIPERFEKVVREYPQSQAVKSENCSLTYSEISPNNTARNTVYLF